MDDINHFHELKNTTRNIFAICLPDTNNFHKYNAKYIIILLALSDIYPKLK